MAAPRGLHPVWNPIVLGSVHTHNKGKSMSQRFYNLNKITDRAEEKTVLIFKMYLVFFFNLVCLQNFNLKSRGNSSSMNDCSEILP